MHIRPESFTFSSEMFRISLENRSFQSRFHDNWIFFTGFLVEKRKKNFKETLQCQRRNSSIQKIYQQLRSEKISLLNFLPRKLLINIFPRRLNIYRFASSPRAQTFLNLFFSLKCLRHRKKTKTQS